VKKSDVLDVLSNMPDDIDPDDLLYRLYLKRELEIAEGEVAAGDVLPHDEVVRLSREWSK
jgi:hypothetical protein